jgi:uncharacterized membrane protein YsdA (DUF1294 family)
MSIGMSMEIERVGIYGDMLAIPAFALLLWYLLDKQKHQQQPLTWVEKALLLFAIIGLIVDISLTAYRFS